LPMQLRKFRESFRPHQGRVAGQDDYIFRAAAERSASNEHRVARATWRVLYGGLHAERFEDGRNFVGLMPNDCNDASELQGLTGAYDVFD
jgi:hypothetical protein